MTILNYDKSKELSLFLKNSADKKMNPSTNEGVLDVYPFYQPIVDVRENSIVGVEVLSRVHVGNEYILSENHIDVLEKHENADFYTIKLLRETQELIIPLQKKYKIIPDGFIFSLNITSRQIDSASLMSSITEFKAAFDNRITLQLEIVERHIVSVNESILNAVDFYNSIGVRFAIDDLGINSLSLKYFGINNISIIKLDHSITMEYQGALIYQKLISAVFTIAKECGLIIIAEGVENSRQEELLHELGIYYMQGFYYSPPVSGSELGFILARG